MGGIALRVLELPDTLRKYGVEPVLVAGWAARGNEFPTRPDGALRHWTVGSLREGIPSLGILTNGRSDLPGPLCQVGQERAEASKFDRAYVIASGKANHAGDGVLNGITGNYKLLGLEIEWTGPNEAFSGRRKDVSERIMRALLDCCTGTNDNDVGEHREYARPAGRKVDTNLSGDELRRRMTELRTQSPGGFLMALTDAEQKDLLEKVRFLADGAPAYGVNGVPIGVAQLQWSIDGAAVEGRPKPIRHIIEEGLAALPAKVAAALPPSSTGGITVAQVEAAVKKVIAAELGFLKPGT